MRHTKRYELTENETNFLGRADTAKTLYQIWDKRLSSVTGTYKTFRGAALKWNRLVERADKIILTQVAA